MVTATALFSQEELLNKIKKGDLAAFGFLYDHYSLALQGIIDSTCKDPGTSEKILHESFIRIWEQLTNFDPKEQRLFTWMLGIMRQVGTEIMDSDKKSSETHIYTDTKNVYAQEALHMVYLKGLSLKETAKTLQISVDDLKTKLAAEIKLLRTIKEK